MDNKDFNELLASVQEMDNIVKKVLNLKLNPLEIKLVCLKPDLLA
jgi:hypothetical protein